MNGVDRHKPIFVVFLIFSTLLINPDAAIQAAQDIRQQVKILINNPGAGTAIDDGTGDRELYIQSGKHGYVVRYKPLYDAKLIRVLQVWHGREDR